MTAPNSQKADGHGQGIPQRDPARVVSMRHAEPDRHLGWPNPEAFRDVNQFGCEEVSRLKKMPGEAASEVAVDEYRPLWVPGAHAQHQAAPDREALREQGAKPTALDY
jgi:hypothetical protein